MELEVVEQQFGPLALAEALAAARTYAERSLSESTRRLTALEDEPRRAARDGRGRVWK